MKIVLCLEASSTGGCPAELTRGIKLARSSLVDGMLPGSLDFSPILDIHLVRPMAKTLHAVLARALAKAFAKALAKSSAKALVKARSIFDFCRFRLFHNVL